MHSRQNWCAHDVSTGSSNGSRQMTHVGALLPSPAAPALPASVKSPFRRRRRRLRRRRRRRSAILGRRPVAAGLSPSAIKPSPSLLLSVSAARDEALPTPLLRGPLRRPLLLLLDLGELRAMNASAASPPLPPPSDAVGSGVTERIRARRPGA